LSDTDSVEQTIRKIISDDPAEWRQSIEFIVRNKISPKVLIYSFIDADKLERLAKVGYSSTPHETQWNELGIAYWRSGLVTFATGVFERLVKKGSNFPTTLHNFAVVTYDLDPLKSYKLAKRANETEQKMFGPRAALQPAGRLLATIEDSGRSLQLYQNLSYVASAVALVVIALVLVLFQEPGPSWSDSEQIISLVIEIDGFVFAFIGTFSIFILQQYVQKPFKKSAVRAATLPLFLWTSGSIVIGIVELLRDSAMPIGFIAVPVIALAAALPFALFQIQYSIITAPPAGQPEAAS
jgi:hypothetical protein